MPEKRSSSLPPSKRLGADSPATPPAARLANKLAPFALIGTLLAPTGQLAFGQPQAKPAASTAPAAPPSTAPVASSAAPAATPSAAPAAPQAVPTPATTAAPTAAPAGDDTGPSEAQKDEAKAHFEKGLKLFTDNAWAPALAEFLRSRELFPTRAATRNASVCLRKLQRYDEALAMFETLLRDFPNMPAGERESAQKNAAELRDLVGTIEVSGAESGASIVISGTDRGEYPPVVPLRVPAGSHVVRLVKEGFEPFETRVQVAGGQLVPVAAKMKKLADSGTLTVSERGNRSLDVLVDGGLVGKTPWKGLLGVGPHTVVLRGTGLTGTQPVGVVVKSQQTSTLTLTAEELDAALRVEPTPGGATVAIDGVTVGSGIWLGRLKSGPHKVEVTADGFRPASRDVKLEKGGRPIVQVALERDPNAAFWQKPSRFAIDISAGLPIVPSFGGDVAGKCTDGCSVSPGLGALGVAHGTYELGNGFGFGLSLGYLFAFQTVENRTTELVPYARAGEPPPQTGHAKDVMQLSSFLGGVHLSYRFGEEIPVLLRASGGVMVGSFRDERSGTFVSTTGALAGTNGLQYDTDTLVDRKMALYGFVDLEPKVGYRIAKDMDLSLGVQAILLVAITQPTWDATLETFAGTDGRGTYRSEPTFGSLVFGIAPTFSYRYYF